MLKLTDGSGGESHFVIILCRIWLAVGMFELRDQGCSNVITNSLLEERQDCLLSVVLSRLLTTSRIQDSVGKLEDIFPYRE